ncbi:MAG: metalloregulator ArsR/SmtB family transcription factor [Rhodospirillaceae bacterium]
MKEHVAAAMLSALGHEARLAVFRLLSAAGEQGLSAGALAGALGVPPSTLSFHLKDLRMAGLIDARRVGRSIIYRADPDAVGVMLGFLQGRATAMASGVYTVLFLCTGNTARSIMAEAILNHEGSGRFKAYSAGSQPRGSVHPEALRLLERQNYPIDGLRSKGWEKFAAPGAPVMDFVFTVCDDAAQEACPTWPGQPMSAHWGVPDPAAFQGDEKATALVFADAFRMLYNRIGIFTCLPIASLDRLSLQTTLDNIGRCETP